MADLKNNNINYYYLDGLEKKGPYNSEEIKSRKLSLETLIFKEGADTWSPLAHFPELHQIKVEQFTETKPDSKLIITKVGKGKIKIPSAIIICLGLVLCFGISFLIAHIEKMNDLKNFKSEIDKIFNGKDVISDYRLRGTTGQLYKVILFDAFDIGIGDKVWIGIEKRELKQSFMHKPILKEKPNEYEVQKYNRELRKWNDFNELVEYYEADRNTGFTVLRLEKYNDMYNIKESWSGDMAYKVGEYNHHPGYDIPTYRPSVSTTYEEAAKFLTVENEDKSYEAGSYSKIYLFDWMKSDFYKIEQTYPRYYYFSDTIFVENGPGEYGRNRSYMIDRDNISRNTSLDDANVYSNQWIVWYKSYTNRYSIKEKEWIHVRKALVYSIGLFFIFLVSFFILKYRKRIQI